jgi:hypothetical protein
MVSQLWEIRIRGPLPPSISDELGVLGLTEEPAQTVIRTGELDQSGLHGILERLRNLGLDLVEIRSVPSADPADSG